MGKIMTYQQFLKGYESDEILVYVVKQKAGDFIMSNFALKKYKYLHATLAWTGVLTTFIVSFVLIFINWKIAIISFIFGMIISGISRKLSTKLVLSNMLKSEDFWDYILLHGGAKITDEMGNEIGSAFLHKMASDK